MDRWIGKIAVVTGASSGIGASICKALVREGVIVIGLARRVAQIDELNDDCLKAMKGKLYAHECDVSNEESIKAAFEWIEKEFNYVHILINNAGISRCTMLLADDNLDVLQEVIKTNYIGGIICLKAAFKLMKKSNDYGHIININSILGHGVPVLPVAPTYNVYPGTKHAITATSEVLRQELNFFKIKNIKVSSISPGLVRTGICDTYPKDTPIFDLFPSLDPDDVSQGIIYALSTGPNCQVYELILKPVGEMA